MGMGTLCVCVSLTPTGSLMGSLTLSVDTSAVSVCGLTNGDALTCFAVLCGAAV